MWWKRRSKSAKSRVNQKQVDDLVYILSGNDNTSFSSQLIALIEGTFYSVQGVEGDQPLITMNRTTIPGMVSPTVSNDNNPHNDFDAFLEFTNSGGFSADTLPAGTSQAEQRNGVFNLLFTISLSLTGYTALLPPGVDPVSIKGIPGTRLPCLVLRLRLAETRQSFRLLRARRGRHV